MYTKTKRVIGSGDTDVDCTFPFSVLAAGSGDATLVKAGPCQLVSIHAINVSAAVRYLRFYDTSIKPTVGAGTPIRRYGIPGATTGAGFVLQPPLPMRFTQGIGFTLTTGVADTDTAGLTANDVILTLEYV